MAIPQEYIAELSRRTDISELIGSYVQLKRAGRLEKGLCPFHNEKTSSFTVYPESQSFYCFGCGAGGDAITFIKRIQNLEYTEAVRFLASRAGMPLPEEDDDAAKRRGRLLAINRETARFYAGILNEEAGRAARVYLRGRALDDKTIRRFGLGFAPDGFGALRDSLKSRGFTEDELLVAGVCKKSEKGGVYDAFRNRVIFPIIDLRGNVIAFGGRKMADDDFGPKYLNSPETQVFKKSRSLYAMNIAKKSVSKRYLLAEGYMDVISLHQAGFDTAIATLGTAITDEQAGLMADYADEVVICYDADEAGQKATAKAIDKFSRTNVKVRVLSLPEAKDPDEFIRKNGPERFAAVLEGSGNALEYELMKAKRGFDLQSDDGRAGYLRAALDILAAEARPVEQDIYAGRLAEETAVGKDAILKQLETVNRQRWKRVAKQREKKVLDEGLAAGVSLPPSTGAKALGVAFAEQQLVAALLKNPADFLPAVRPRLAPEGFISPDMAEAYRLILQAEDAGLPVELPVLAGQLPEKTVDLLGKVLAQNHQTGFALADVELFLNRIEEGANTPARASEMEAEELRRLFETMKDKKK